jgi:uncharacterized protein YdhG (YjbR/CyaY superfamily)/transcriptional regulator with XRE-family HTH domain
LRREEVAQLAGMSTDYLARLEQSRGPQPSTQVLAALARALRLTDDERDHLYYVAGRTPPAFHRPNAHVSPGLLHVLDHLTDSAAFVVSDLGETLVQNPVAIALHGDESHPQGLDRYLIWRWFTDPATRAKFPEEDWPTHSRTHVADLRATAARRQGDPDVVELVPKSRTVTGKASKGFTDEAAMKERAQELKAKARRGKADGESAVLAKIAEMPEPDRTMGERLHVIIKASAPVLSPKLWCGMPAYAKGGKVVCFFQSADKFKSRYATLGFNEDANLDEGAMWPASFALKDLTAAEEARIAELVNRAVS